MHVQAAVAAAATAAAVAAGNGGGQVLFCCTTTILLAHTTTVLLCLNSHLDVMQTDSGATVSDAADGRNGLELATDATSSLSGVLTAHCRLRCQSPVSELNPDRSPASPTTAATVRREVQPVRSNRQIHRCYNDNWFIVLQVAVSSRFATAAGGARVSVWWGE